MSKQASVRIKQCGLTWTCRHVKMSPCFWLKLDTEVPVVIWIRDKFKLKIDRSVKTPWLEYGAVAGSYSWALVNNNLHFRKPILCFVCVVRNTYIENLVTIVINTALLIIICYTILAHFHFKLSQTSRQPEVKYHHYITGVRWKGGVGRKLLWFDTLSRLPNPCKHHKYSTHQARMSFGKLIVPESRVLQFERMHTLQKYPLYGIT